MWLEQSLGEGEVANGIREAIGFRKPCSEWWLLLGKSPLERIGIRGMACHGSCCKRLTLPVEFEFKL